MIWALSILFAYAGMLAAAPGPTLKVSAVFAALAGSLLGLALMAEAVFR